MMTVEELGNATRQQPAIVSVKIGRGQTHAIVVDQVKRGYVYIRDPMTREAAEIFERGGWIKSPGVSYRMKVEDFSRAYVRDGKGRGKTVTFFGSVPNGGTQ